MSDEELTLSVSQYIDVVNNVLKSTMGEGVWIQGEIEGFNNRTKHTYFNVVERSDGKKASVNVAIWEFNLKRLKPLLEKHRLTLADGIKVRLFGTGDLYAERGSFSFKVSNIDPRFTLGDLAGQRDEIVQKLKLAGLYEANKRVKMPVVPLRIALLTSIGSAAHADTLHELEASGIGFEVFVYDVCVQGEDAAPTVVAAMKQAAKRDDIDLIMLVRGGGSKTDLLAFDTEEIASGIGNCAKPVFTGSSKRSLSLAPFNDCAAKFNTSIGRLRMRSSERTSSCSALCNNSLAVVAICAHASSVDCTNSFTTSATPAAHAVGVLNARCATSSAILKSIS